MADLTERKQLAVEILLTSGLITFKDLTEGLMTDGTEGVPELRLVALNVLVGGLDGATRVDMAAGSLDPAVMEAADESIWTAVTQVLADSAPNEAL